MRAAVYYGAHDIRVEDVQGPTGLRPGEVRIEPAFVGICGTDLHEYAEGPIVIHRDEPHPLTGTTLPQILGHELSAVIRELGPGVTDLMVGDRVAVNPVLSCGTCVYCRSGEAQVCPFFAGYGLNATWGGLADEGVVQASMCTVLPESVSLKQGAVVEPAKVAGYAVDRARVRAGGSVLIMGGGPIGVLAALYAHAMGVATIIVAEPNPARRARVDALGIATVVDPVADDLAGIVLAHTHGLGVDAAIEAAGKEPALIACIDAVRPRGVVVQAALHTKPVSFDPMPLSLKDATMEFTWCFKVHDWQRTVDLIATGTFPVEKSVTSTIRLEDVATKGFDALLDPRGDDVKILIDLSL